MSNNSPNYINQPIYADEMFNFKKDVNAKEDVNNTVNKMLQGRRANYIYFKKNCKEWSHPRINLFNTQSASSYTGICSDGSPYMEDMGNDLYRFLLPPYWGNCEKVIFFCDKKSKDGLYYQTTDSYIPIGDMYEQPIYYQSSIGYDGIWGDYLTNSFKIAILFNSKIKLNNKELITNHDSDGIVKVSIQNNDTELLYDLVNNSNSSNNQIQGPAYQFIDVPFDFKEFTISTQKYKNYQGNITESVSRTIELDKICYGIPVLGIITSSNVNPDVRGIYTQAEDELDSSVKRNRVENDYDFYIRYNVMSDPRLYALYNLIKDKVINGNNNTDRWNEPFDTENE